MKVRVMKVFCVSGYLKVGEIYDVFKDAEGVTYIIDSQNDKLYFDLETGASSWFRPELDDSRFIFEEVKEQPKYATSPEVLAQVFRKMADNVEKGLRPKEGLQVKMCGEFGHVLSDCLELKSYLEYRVKPESITLKNGIEVPKPLSIDELQEGALYHFPTLTKYLYDSCYRDWLIENEVAFVYATKEEAIEASKALFGLEVKE